MMEVAIPLPAKYIVNQKINSLGQDHLLICTAKEAKGKICISQNEHPLT
jgi:hypothetical protein